MALLDTTALLALQNQLPLALKTRPIARFGAFAMLLQILLRRMSSPTPASSKNGRSCHKLLLSWHQINNSSMRESGLYLLAQVGEYAPEYLQRGKQHVFGTPSNIFGAASADNNALSLDGKVYLTQATINFMLSLDENNLGDCEVVMQPLLNTLSQLLQAGEEINAQDAMKSLMDLACNDLLSNTCRKEL